MPAEIQIDAPGSGTGTQSPFSQTGTAVAAGITLTQAAVAGKTLFVESIEITGGGATAASDIIVTLASGGTTIANWIIPVPLGAGVGIVPLVIDFSTPVAGLAPGQNMVLTIPSFGAGNLAAAANMRGFSQ